MDAVVSGYSVPSCGQLFLVKRPLGEAVIWTLIMVVSQYSPVVGKKIYQSPES